VIAASPFAGERKIVDKDRRNFLKMAGITAAAGVTGVATACQSTAVKIPPIDHSLSENRFWKRVQEQFALDPDQVYMNIGTTGAMPLRVLDNFDTYNRVVARRPMGYADELGWDFGLDKQRENLSKQFGCTKDEISFTRNTTDALNTLLFGLPFDRGNEILITHHEHVSALSPLNILKDRFGVVLTEVEIPVLDLEHDDQVLEAFRQKITTETRAILFSHITYKTGPSPRKGHLQNGP
jgi:isopenicillin-N epimerase